MVYAKEIKNGNVVALLAYNFDPAIPKDSGIVIISEEEYRTLSDEIQKDTYHPMETDQISDSEALSIITGEVD
jgi:hypothetical protein